MFTLVWNSPLQLVKRGKKDQHFAPCLEGPGFNSRPSQTKEFKWVAEAPLSNSQHIKGSSMQTLVDPLP